MFACNEGNLYYVKKKGEKRNIYRMDLSTGKKKKIYSTRNTVVGVAWTTGRKYKLINNRKIFYYQVNKLEF